MRVAYLSTCYPAVSHSFIRREILALEDIGHDVERYSIRPPNPVLPDRLDREEAGRTFVILDQAWPVLVGSTIPLLFRKPRRWFRTLQTALSMRTPGLRSLVRHLAYFAEACFLARRLERHPVDHVHAHFGTNSATVALLTSTLGGPPFSFTAHGMDEVEGAEEYRIGLKVAEAKFAVAASDFVGSQLMRWSEVTHWPKIQTVYCGLDDRFLEPQTSAPPSHPALCFVGRLSREKGVPVLLEAAALLSARGVDFTLRMIGDGPLRAAVENQIRDYGLEGRVELLGSQDSVAVRELILESRTLVLPSFAEGLPVVIMEALALGRPVVASGIAGIPELVDSRCGWLVSPGSADQLADALAAALSASPAELDRMGKAGRERVLERHDSRRNAEQLGALFGSTDILGARSTIATAASAATLVD